MALALLFGVHGHQPVGNFAAVLDRAHERCYAPFLRTLHRYPDFRFAVHFSGWLLEYLLARFPSDLTLLREMVDRGQAELFGGGDCEPVLAAIPYRDRIGQLQAMRARLERHFGTAPRGAWLTERVWEASVVPALAACGIRYVPLDDYHFLCAGKSLPELDGYYTAEEDGATLDLFPISEELRYKLPFSPAAEAIACLERMHEEGRRAAIYFDDIEKFGIWPETYEWVYERGWLEQFIEGVLGSPHLRAPGYREFHEHNATRGIAYLPAASYFEMNEWTLPPAAAEAYAELEQREREAGRYERDKGFLRGGIWRGFLMRYPEANWMHKRMMALSERRAALDPEGRDPLLTQLLYRAQCNDAYWHGLFGGIYLPHLRRAVYRNLLELEQRLDALRPRPATARLDLDRDGAEELFLTREAAQAVVRLDGEAALVEFDSYRLRHNFGDVLRRVPEHYHRKIHERPRPAPRAPGIASAHERVAFRHEIAPEDLAPDPRRRGLFQDAWSAPASASAPVAGYLLERFEPGARTVFFRAALGGGRILKRYALEEERLLVRYRLEGAGAGTFATELNLALPSCEGPGGRYVAADGSVAGGFGASLAVETLERIALEDRELGGALLLALAPPGRLCARPHYTVSQSEDGFERVMQGVAIELAWPVAGETAELSIVLEVRVDPHPRD